MNERKYVENKRNEEKDKKWFISSCRVGLDARFRFERESPNF